MHALHQRWTAPCAPSQAMRAQNLSCVQHAVAEAAADRVVERRRAGRVMGWSLFYYFLSMVSSPPQGRGPGTFALQRTKLCLPPLWSTPARAPLFTMALRVAALNVVCATALEHTCQGILREQLRKGKLSALGWTEAAACVCTTRLLRFKAAPQAAVGMPPLPGLSAAGTAAGARCHPGRRAEPHNLTAALCPGCRTGRRADRPYPTAAQVLAVILGIALTYIIRPGRDLPFSGSSSGDCAAKNTDTIMGKQCAPGRCCLRGPAAARGGAGALRALCDT